MNLTEWRKSQEAGTEAELPSGLRVTLKKVSLPDMVAMGSIPKSLSSIVEDGLFGRAIKTGEEEGATLEDFQKFRELVEFMAGNALVGPKGLDVGELGWADQYAIFDWLTESGERRKLKTFPVTKS